MPRPEVFISFSDDVWDLERQASQDKARHDRKLREVLKGNIADIVSSHDIISSDGNDTIKVPVKSLDLPTFSFDQGKSKGYGSGDGSVGKGDIVAHEPGQGNGPGAGNEPGEDYYEAEVSISEIEKLVFEDLSLPNFVEKQHHVIESSSTEWTDVRKSGPMSLLDKRRSLKNNLIRNAASGNPHVGGWKKDDLRFKSWEDKLTPQSNAVILAMMDTSGSMGQMEKYIARSFYFWMTRFLRTQYDRSEIVFIAHHTEAKVVSEGEFFKRGESGGTMCSSAYQLALDLVDSEYDPSAWNIYPYHFSDGDNYSTDNEKCVGLLNRLLSVSSAGGYGEIRAHDYSGYSTLRNEFDKVEQPNFTSSVLRGKNDVWPTLQQFFSSSPISTEGRVRNI